MGIQLLFFKPKCSNSSKDHNPSRGSVQCLNHSFYENLSLHAVRPAKNEEIQGVQMGVVAVSLRVILASAWNGGACSSFEERRDMRAMILVMNSALGRVASLVVLLSLGSASAQVQHAWVQRERGENRATAVALDT